MTGKDGTIAHRMLMNVMHYEGRIHFGVHVNIVIIQDDKELRLSRVSRCSDLAATPILYSMQLPNDRTPLAVR